MILTTFTPSEHTAAELAAATVEVKYGGRVCDIGADKVSELDVSRIAPIRITKVYPGREYYSGVYWSATTGRHHWVSLGMAHFPDFFIRRSDGSRLIVDVRPRRLIEARDAELFAITAAWAASLEMDYRLFADLTKVEDWNLRLLLHHRGGRGALARRRRRPLLYAGVGRGRASR